MDINRLELVGQLVAKHGYTKKDAITLIDDFTDIILDNLGKGNSVSLYGFGRFDLLERKERSCPNPQTGETVVIPAHWAPKFYPGKKMRLQVKIWEDNKKRGLI